MTLVTCEVSSLHVGADAAFFCPSKYSCPKLLWWKIVWWQEKGVLFLAFLLLANHFTLVFFLWTPVHRAWCILLSSLVFFFSSIMLLFKPSQLCAPLFWVPGHQMPVSGQWCRQRILGPVCMLTVSLLSCWFSLTPGIPWFPPVWQVVLNSWAQVTLPPLPPKYLWPQLGTTVPGDPSVFQSVIQLWPRVDSLWAVPPCATDSTFFVLCTACVSKEDDEV